MCLCPGNLRPLCNTNKAPPLQSRKADRHHHHTQRLGSKGRVEHLGFGREETRLQGHCFYRNVFHLALIHRFELKVFVAEADIVTSLLCTCLTGPVSLEEVSYPQESGKALAAARSWPRPSSVAALTPPPRRGVRPGVIRLHRQPGVGVCVWPSIRVGNTANSGCPACSPREDKALGQRKVPVILTCWLWGFPSGLLQR